MIVQITEEQLAELAAAMLMAAEHRHADPAECSHCFKAGVNANLAVCILCRTRICEPTSAGLMLCGIPGGDSDAVPLPDDIGWEIAQS